MSEGTQPGLEVDRRQTDLYSVQHPADGPEVSGLHHKTPPNDVNDYQYDEKVTHLTGQRHERIPLGLSPLWFGLIAAAAGFIIGGALAGGLGAGLSKSSTKTVVEPCTASNSSSSNTSTPTGNPTAFTYALPVSNFTVPPFMNVTSAYTTCPGDSPTYTDTMAQTYKTECGLVYPPNGQADASIGGVIGDLAGTLAYSLEDCTTQCSLWNTDGAIPHDRVCRGVSWVPDVGSGFKHYGSNCVLKNATGPGSPTGKPYIVSAKLMIGGS